MKIWNGRGVNNAETLYICANSKADACRMLEEIYPYINKGRWYREMTGYFNEGCWGIHMDGVEQERGVWLSKDHDRVKPVRIYPKEKP